MGIVFLKKKKFFCLKEKSIRKMESLEMEEGHYDHP